MDKSKSAYRIFTKPEGWKPWRRREDNVKILLKGIRVLVWTQFDCPTVGLGERLLWKRWWIFWLNKMHFLTVWGVTCSTQLRGRGFIWKLACTRHWGRFAWQNQHSVRRSFILPWVGVHMFWVQCIAVNIRFSLTTFTEGAGISFMRSANTASWQTECPLYLEDL